MIDWASLQDDAGKISIEQSIRKLIPEIQNRSYGYETDLNR